jgi:dTDP-4-amino-4,6-dideoxygalactose transaminase
MIRFQTPQLPPLDAIGRYFERAERDRWYSNSGPCARLLTERLETRVGRGAHCLLVANGTLGLMVALHALTSDRVEGASEVLVPTFTFVATINAIAWAGLTPVFVDLDPDDWHPSHAAIEHALSTRAGKVAAVLSTSTFGTPPSPAVRTRLERTCADAGVPLLFDSAAGFGARDVDGHSLGLQGDVELFSVHATKPFAIGEGGMLATSSDALFERMARLVNFGIDQDRALTELLGLNAKLSELHAATGLAVLDRFDDILRARRTRAARVRDALEPRGFEFQQGNERSTWQFIPTLAPSAEGRAAVMREAARRSIEVRRYFTPCHHFPACAAFPRVGSLSVADALADRMLSLPMANDLTETDVEQIIECCLVATASDPSSSWSAPAHPAARA